MIAGGIIHAETAPVDSASLLAQSSQPSRQPSTSSPTPEHRATSFGKVIVVLIHVVLTLGLFRRLCARHHSDTLVIRPEQITARAILISSRFEVHTQDQYDHIEYRADHSPNV
jgi:hypothetical protein